MVEKLLLVVLAVALYAGFVMLQRAGLGHVGGVLVALYVVWSANHILGQKQHLTKVSQWADSAEQRIRNTNT